MNHPWAGAKAEGPHLSGRSANPKLLLLLLLALFGLLSFFQTGCKAPNNYANNNTLYGNTNQPPKTLKIEPMSVRLDGNIRPLEVRAEVKPLELKLSEGLSNVAVEMKPLEVRLPTNVNIGTIPLRLDTNSIPLQLNASVKLVDSNFPVVSAKLAIEGKPLEVEVKVDGHLIPDVLKLDWGEKPPWVVEVKGLSGDKPKRGTEE